MKEKATWPTMLVGAMLVIGLTLFLSHKSPLNAATVKTSETESARYTRACIHPIGGWTEVDCSAAAAYSAALTVNTRYIVQAVSGDAYWTQTSAGSAQDADSNDGYLPEGSWYEFLTDSTMIYYSCDGSAASATVRHIECQ